MNYSVFNPLVAVDTKFIHIFLCPKNYQAGQDLISIVKHYDRSFTEDKALLLDFNAVDSIYETPTMLILATGMNLIWKNRVQKKTTTTLDLRAELLCLATLLATSNPKKLREADTMIYNSLSNFPT